jgi:hypothetical protein
VSVGVDVSVGVGVSVDVAVAVGLTCLRLAADARRVACTPNQTAMTRAATRTNSTVGRCILHFIGIYFLCENSTAALEGPCHSVLQFPCPLVLLSNLSKKQ